jgi:aryl carrier-like protein
MGEINKVEERVEKVEVSVQERVLGMNDFRLMALKEKLFIQHDEVVTQEALISMGINSIRARLNWNDEYNTVKTLELLKLVSQLDPMNVEPLFACYFTGRGDMMKELLEFNPTIKD